MAHYNTSTTAWEIKYLDREAKRELDGSLKTNVDWIDPSDESKGKWSEVASKAYTVEVKIDVALTSDEIAILTEKGTPKVKVDVSATESDSRIHVWGSPAATPLADGAAEASGGLSFYITAASLTTTDAIIGYVAVSYEGHTAANSSGVYTPDENAPTITLGGSVSLVAA